MAKLVKHRAMGRGWRSEAERAANGATLALIGLLWMVLIPPAALIAAVAGLLSLLRCPDQAEAASLNRR